MEQIFKTLIILLIFQTSLPAQVKFLLDYNARTDEYTVSMMPEETWKAPDNLTAGGQVTLKATTGQFYVKDIKSFLPKTEWYPSGRVNAPKENPTKDYIFFRLETSGLTELPYKAFTPTKLFSFTLASNCAREVSLISNKNDRFLPPNSRNVNIGNSIGVLGAGGDAYVGNISSIPILCPYAILPEETNEKGILQPALVKTESELLESKLLFPNPTIDEVNIKLNWLGAAGEKTILVYNSIGELARFYVQNLQKGSNEFTLNAAELTNGIYNLLLVEEGQNLSLGKIIKVQ